MAANTRHVLVGLALSLLCAYCIAQNNDTETTQAAPGPQTTPTTVNPTEVTPTSPSTGIERNTDLANCTCDLTANGCDVNCCCDADCTEDDQFAFSRCDDQFNVVDSQSCVRSELVFMENTPDTIMVNSSVDGLFCVQFDNYESRNYYAVPDLVNTTELFEEYKQKYGPAYSFQQSSEPRNISTDHYRSGDPVYAVYETNALGYLGLPTALGSQLCTDANPAAYLYSQKFECVREITDLATDCMTNPSLNAQTYYTGFRVITSPQAFEELTNNTSEVTTTENPVTVTEDPILEEIPIFNTSYSVDITPDGPHWCVDENGVLTSCSFGADMPTPSFDGSQCSNAVVKMTYTITTNGTEGIRYVSVTFTFQNLTQGSLPLLQQFESKFLTQEENATFIRSGNPGYRLGDPLLAGVIVQSTDADGINVQAIDLDSDRNNWITMASSSVNGECALDMDNRVSVTFGKQMRSGCFVNIYFSNMTTACSQIQQAAWNALRGNNPPDYVATFGNTPVETVGDWVQIFGVNEDPPTPSQSQTPGVCRNMITGLHMEFIYSNVGSLANPQVKVIGASYQYHVQDEVRYQCVGAYCVPGNEGARQRVEVVSSVGFVDASTKAIPASAEKPTVTARLPEDFFYPFS